MDDVIMCDAARKAELGRGRGKMRLGGRIEEVEEVHGARDAEAGLG